MSKREDRDKRKEEVSGTIDDGWGEEKSGPDEDGWGEAGERGVTDTDTATSGADTKTETRAKVTTATDDETGAKVRAEREASETKSSGAKSSGAESSGPKSDSATGSKTGTKSTAESKRATASERKPSESAERKPSAPKSSGSDEASKGKEEDAEARLRDAVFDGESGDDGGGKKKAKKRKKGDGGGRRRGLYAVLVIAGLLLVGAGGVFAWLNHKHFYLVCGAEAISAERGSLWPWGKSRLEGERWRPIAIPPDAECQSRRFQSRSALQGAFLDALVDRASSQLAPGPPKDLEEVEAQLTQALLLTRDPEQSDRRKAIERLFGDVEYWRAAAEVNSAIGELEQAAERFEAAVERNPRHQRDSSTWAEYAREMSEELRRGPPSLREDEETPEHPKFAGTATSPGTSEEEEEEPAATSPGSGEEEEEEPAQSDAGPGKAVSAPPDAAPKPPPDAGLPTGGVLL